jgi:hypothetical protein
MAKVERERRERVEAKVAEMANEVTSSPDGVIVSDAINQLKKIQSSSSGAGMIVVKNPGRLKELFEKYNIDTTFADKLWEGWGSVNEEGKKIIEKKGFYFNHSDRADQVLEKLNELNKAMLATVGAGRKTRRRMRKAGAWPFSKTPSEPVPPPKNDEFSNENPLAKDTIEKNALKVKVRAKLKQAYKGQPFVDNMVPGLTLEELRKIDKADANDIAALDTVVIPINFDWADRDKAKKGASRRKSRRKSSTRRR